VGLANGEANGTLNIDTGLFTSIDDRVYLSTQGNLTISSTISTSANIIRTESTAGDVNLGADVTSSRLGAYLDVRAAGFINQTNGSTRVGVTAGGGLVRLEADTDANSSGTIGVSGTPIRVLQGSGVVDKLVSGSPGTDGVNTWVSLVP
jgi:hypothetical protein